MNLFDGLGEKLAGSAGGGGGEQGLVTSILEMLSNRQGGLSGLAGAFNHAGLGSIVSSWIGTGQNLPVSADQIQQVLGNDQIQAFAQKAGISTESAGGQLAQLLPGIVDKLTPGGQIPMGGDLMSIGAGLLRNLMSGDKPDS
jgi:uncharacterized protein YidB (DUF937 family)